MSFPFTHFCQTFNAVLILKSDSTFEICTKSRTVNKNFNFDSRYRILFWIVDSGWCRTHSLHHARHTHFSNNLQGYRNLWKKFDHILKIGSLIPKYNKVNYIKAIQSIRYCHMPSKEIWKSFRFTLTHETAANELFSFKRWYNTSTLL